MTPSTCIIETQLHHCTEHNKFEILLRLRNAQSSLDSSAGNSNWQKYEQTAGQRRGRETNVREHE